MIYKLLKNSTLICYSVSTIKSYYINNDNDNEVPPARDKFLTNSPKCSLRSAYKIQKNNYLKTPLPSCSNSPREYTLILGKDE